MPDPSSEATRPRTYLDISVGQVWRSKDRRENGSLRVVVEAPTAHMGYVVTERAGRRSRIRPSSLLSRYTLVKDAEQ